MTERPILFSGPMVRALLEGRKTQTRRVVKVGTKKGNELSDWLGSSGPTRELLNHIRCPYGVPGDRLWVRESAYIAPVGFDEHASNFMRDADGRKRVISHAATTSAAGKAAAGDYGVRLTPSIHMPRWASRLTLEITGVRVERVQDISEADARAEGFDDSPELGPRGHFIGTWIALNGRESWQANPWVWVLDFKRSERTGEG